MTAKIIWMAACLSMAVGTTIYKNFGTKFLYVDINFEPVSNSKSINFLHPGIQEIQPFLNI